MSDASIRKPQNIRTCIDPTNLSLRTRFCPSQPDMNSLRRALQEPKRSSGAPSITRRVAFCTW